MVRLGVSPCQDHLVEAVLSFNIYMASRGSTQVIRLAQKMPIFDEPPHQPCSVILNE